MADKSKRQKIKKKKKDLKDEFTQKIHIQSFLLSHPHTDGKSGEDS